jgi:hypothetical protein
MFCSVTRGVGLVRPTPLIERSERGTVMLSGALSSPLMARTTIYSKPASQAVPRIISNVPDIQVTIIRRRR